MKSVHRLPAMSAIPLRRKRASDPLDEKAKARLRGNVDNAHRSIGCAGSDSQDEATALCLSVLVRAFNENLDADDSPTSAHYVPFADPQNSRTTEAADAMVRGLVITTAESDTFRFQLAADVSAAVEVLASSRLSSSPLAFRRAVVAQLAGLDYNAGICKVRWDAAAGITAGSYEYIDVLAAESVEQGAPRRYIVDLDFAGEFDVARPTEEYKRILAALPRVAVAGEETLRQVLRVVADAARRSLQARDLHVPPWRKSRYMIAKWLGPYRRGTEAATVSEGTAAGGTGAEVFCRAVGFAPLRSCSRFPSEEHANHTRQNEDLFF